MEPTEQETELIRIADDGTMATIDTLTGEILSVADAPGTQFAHEIAEFVGPRLAVAASELAGIEAARAAYMQRGADLYDAKIKQKAEYVDYLKNYGRDTLREYAERTVTEKTRTVQIGQLRLSHHRNPASTKIVDKAAALAWAKRYCPAAVKVEESVLVSKISPSMATRLPEDSGLLYVEPYDKFEVK